MLVAAASAYARAINTYTATFALLGGKGGTANKPAPLSFKQNINATGTNGNRTATLLDIKTKVYGMVADGKDFPTCTLGKIAAAKSDTACPKGALVATGAITAMLGSATDFTLAAGAPRAIRPACLERRAGQARVLLRRRLTHAPVPQRRPDDRSMSALPGDLQAGGQVPRDGRADPEVRRLPEPGPRRVADDRT